MPQADTDLFVYTLSSPQCHHLPINLPCSSPRYSLSVCPRPLICYLPSAAATWRSNTSCNTSATLEKNHTQTLWERSVYYVQCEIRRLALTQSLYCPRAAMIVDYTGISHSWRAWVSVSACTLLNASQYVLNYKPCDDWRVLNCMLAQVRRETLSSNADIMPSSQRLHTLHPSVHLTTHYTLMSLCSWEPHIEVNNTLTGLLSSILDHKKPIYNQRPSNKKHTSERISTVTSYFNH